MDELRKAIDSASTSITNVTKNLAESNRYTDTLIDSMRKLSGIGTVQGSIWSVIGRFFAGNQVFFKINNQIRSVTVAARVLYNIEKERVESAEELNKLMQRQGNFLEEFLNTNRAIEKIQGGSDDRLTKAIMMQETINKLKIRELGLEEYLNQSRKDALVGISEQLKNEREIVDVQKARSNLSPFSKGRLGDNFKTGFFGDPDLESRVVQLFGIDDEIRTLRNALKETDDDDEKEKLQTEIDDRLTMTGVLREQLKGLGVDVETYGAAGTTKSVSKSPTESFFKRLNTDPKGTIKKLFLPSAELLNFIKRVAIFKVLKKNIQIIGKMAILILPLLGKIGLAFGMLGLLVFILHQSGFIERMGAFLNNENFQKMLGFYFDMVILTFGGIFDIVKGIFNILIGLFSGDGGQVYAGLKNIGMGFLKILGGLIGGIVSGAVITVVGVIGTGVNLIVSALDLLYQAGKKIKRHAPKLGVVGGAIAGMKAGAVAGSIVPGAGTVGGMLIGGVGGALIGFGVGTAVEGLASGGTVGRGGMFLVGEKGPELVNLPTGSTVFSNSQTRGMGNTINVSVNGRVGASDAELDDIARKIGQKINLEMNRYNNAGYRV